MPAVTVTDKTFGRDVLVAPIPVLVEFSAAHSPPVAALEDLCGALDGRVRIVKVDVDRYPSLKEDYAVRGLPAMILFKRGKPVARRVGSQITRAESSTITWRKWKRPPPRKYDSTGGCLPR